MSLYRTLRRLIGSIPLVRPAVVRYYRYKEHRRIAKLGSAQDVFDNHYHKNEWNSNESVSGPGSTLEYTENIRKEMPALAESLGVKVVLDAPCGDYNWFGQMPWAGRIHYIGGDIVRPLIEHNQTKFGNSQREFMQLNIIADKLPPADLWLCRDCWIHLSYEDMFGTIANFLKSDIKYLLTTTYPRTAKNEDIPTGAFHPINLEIAPFNFGEPGARIEDWIEGFPYRQVALWERETLAQRLANNPVLKANR